MLDTLPLPPGNIGWVKLETGPRLILFPAADPEVRFKFDKYDQTKPDYIRLPRLRYGLIYHSVGCYSVVRVDKITAKDVTMSTLRSFPNQESEFCFGRNQVKNPADAWLYIWGGVFNSDLNRLFYCWLYKTKSPCNKCAPASRHRHHHFGHTCECCRETCECSCQCACCLGCCHHIDRTRLQSAFLNHFLPNEPAATWAIATSDDGPIIFPGYQSSWEVDLSEERSEDFLENDVKKVDWAEKQNILTDMTSFLKYK